MSERPPRSESRGGLPFLTRTSHRFARRHPAQFGLGLLGIALGIAVVVAIDVAVASSKRAFSLSVETVTGEATHRIVGDGFGLDQDLYRKLRIDHGFRELAPVVEAEVMRLEPERGVVTLVGIDPYAEAGFRDWQPTDGVEDEGFDDWTTKLVTRAGTCVLSSSALASLGATLGDELRFRVGGRVRSLRVVATLTEANDLDRRRYASLVLTDIATAQEFLGDGRKLSRIDARLDDDAEVTRLRSVLPAGVRIEPADQRRESLEQMTAAFDLNLRSLSLLALLVGWFLIDNTMSFSVVQRRGVFGRLRTLGVTSRQVFALVLLEGIGFGVLGSVIGGTLGLLLGRTLVDVIAGTVGDLYFAVEVASVTLPEWTLVKGTLLGIGASLIAAWRPAREAGSTDPRDVLRRSTLEARARAGKSRRFVVSCLALAGALVLIALPSRQILVGYGALFLIVVGFAGLTPPAVRLAIRTALRVGGSRLGVVRAYAIRSIDRHLSRTGFAIAALAVAIAMAIGVGIMVSSFRGSVVDWLEETLTGDVYVGLDATVSRRGNRRPIDPELCQRVLNLDGVTGWIANRRFEASTPLGPTEVNARHVHGPQRDVIPVLESKPAGPDRPAILASEPYMFRHGLGLGDTVQISTSRGPVEFEITTIFRDYVSDMGYLAMPRSTYERYWDDRSYTALALYLDPSVSPDAVMKKVEDIATEIYGDDLDTVGFLCSPSKGLRDESLRIFDRTFRITDVLRILATLVAMVGVASAFMALLLERTREFGTLRAAGLTRRGLLNLTTTQSLTMGGIAGVLAIPLGIAFAAVLTLVVNRRSFGWSLDFFIDPAVIAVGFITSIVAAVLAGLIPAWRLARMEPAEALRETEG